MAVILVRVKELHGEGSSNFLYIASVMRQLLGGSGTSSLSLSVVAAEPAGPQPAATMGRPWCGVAQTPRLRAAGGRGSEVQGLSVSSQGNLSAPPVRGEMVSDAPLLYPSAWGRAVGWAPRAVVQQEEMAQPGVKVGGGS